MVKPFVGYIKSEHRRGRDYLTLSQSDAINAILAAVGYNFSLILKCLSNLLCSIILAGAISVRAVAA